MLEIKHKETGKRIVSVAHDSLRGRAVDGIDLAGADFRGMDLSACMFTSCNLSECDFTGAKLIRTRISNCVAKLAIFEQAVMVECDFSDSVFDLSLIHI